MAAQDDQHRALLDRHNRRKEEHDRVVKEVMVAMRKRARLVFGSGYWRTWRAVFLCGSPRFLFFAFASWCAAVCLEQVYGCRSTVLATN